MEFAMGIIFSFLGYHGRTDDPDPITGLTSREKYLIQSNWELVRKDMTNIGVQILITYFTEFPETINFFPFKDIPLTELPENKKFRAHCANIMYSLSSLIENLNDNDVLLNLIAKIGESHGRRNVTEKNIHDIKGPVLEVVSKNLGSKLTKEAAAAYDKILDVALKSISANLKSNE